MLILYSFMQVCFYSRINHKKNGQFNLQPAQISESWENRFWELSYCIVLELPRIENNEKPLNQ